MPIEPAAASATRPHKLRHAHWRAAVDVLGRVLDGQPADASLQRLFRQMPQCGGRDRAAISALVYGVLRDARALQAMVGTAPADLCAAQVLRSGVADVATLTAFGCADAAGLATRIDAFDPASLSVAQRLNVPDEAWERWCALVGAEEAQSLARALAGEASVDLRVNTLRATRDQARHALADEGLEAVATPLSPWGLRLARRAALQASRAFREGWIELQDEGSQLLALATDAQPGERVVDYCAGAGGKTLALAAMLGGSGELHALDVDAARLQRMAPRLARAGVSRVRVATIADAAPGLAGGADCVLVDAPCSASGTWRRNPELRLRPLELERRSEEQRRILGGASALVRPGGRLLYATCSLFREENEDVVAAFLREHPAFDAEPIAVAGLPPADGLRLWPHRHGTDGFFAARLRRRH